MEEQHTETQNFTDSIVERLPGLLIPNQRGLSLVGHSDSWRTRFNTMKRLFDLNVLLQRVAALATRVTTFNVWDVDVELGELLARPLHALVHRLQDLFGVLLHPADKTITTCHNLWVHLWGSDLSFFTYPSFGKLCLISTWWWLRSSAVLELNTFRGEKTGTEIEGELETHHSIHNSCRDRWPNATW